MQHIEGSRRLASLYLAAWILMRVGSREDAEAVIHYVAPVGQKDEYVMRVVEAVASYLPSPATARAA